MLHALLRIFLLCGLLASGWAQALQLSATRLWPSSDYTRITLEAPQPVAYKYFMLANPQRLGGDLEGVEAGAALDALAGQLSPDDPYIGAIRVGLNRPGVMRLVLDLKTAVKPSVFQLQPLGQYAHRLVVDIYPAQAGDTVASAPAATSQPAVATPAKPEVPQYTRLITVAVDAGHGGEDPGASGANGSHEEDITLALAKKLKQKIDAQENMHAVLIGGVNVDVKDPFLKRTLIDLSQTATINDSLKLGRAVLKEIGGVNTLHKGEVEQAGFAVLKAPDIPSLLIETAFISNPEEEKRLNDPGYQDKLVDAIVDGVKNYFAKHPLTAPSRLTRNP